MSRQLQRTRAPPITDNLYHGTTTSTLPSAHTFKQSASHQDEPDQNYHLKCTGSIRGNPCPLEHSNCFTDEAFTDHNYYDYYDQDDHGYQTSPNRYRGSRTEISNSDDSDAPQNTYYEYEEVSSRRHSRNNPVISDRIGFARQPSVVSGMRRIHPESERAPERCVLDQQPESGVTLVYPTRHFSRISHEDADDAPSAVIYGCGGKCQTFENVCYYFLQVAFTMGILIGISLAIAGWVLRKSAARNLQVLLYIGAMLSLVCALLLGIQCNARKTARMKRRILRYTKRAHIPMELLPTRQSAPSNNPIDAGNTQRGVNITLVQLPSSSGPMLQVQRTLDHRRHPSSVVNGDQQGIPWWRWKDIV